MGITNHPNWDVINNFTESIVLEIKKYQDEFYTKYKYFFQGISLVGSDTKPDGTTNLSIYDTSKATDSDFTWADFAPSVFRKQFKVPVQISLDVFNGPSGRGWMLRLEIWYSGLGVDENNNEGDHWVYNHCNGLGPITGVFDKWHIMPEN